MKIEYIIIVFLLNFLGGCSTNSFYQVYEIQSNEIIPINQSLTYENEDLSITYDFWRNYGTSSFFIHNKTDQDLFVDLGNSHSILNGIAYTYFQNRTYTKSTSSNLTISKPISYSKFNTNEPKSFTTASGTAGKGFSITYYEQRIICIPHHSGKFIEGFDMKSRIYRDCDLFRFPTNKNIISKDFNKENTPFVFKNIIAYSFTEIDNKNPYIVENIFWISRITNYPYNSFFQHITPVFCGEKYPYSRKFYKFEAPNYFYINYVKRELDFLDH